ncbi:MAG TPA: NAD(+) synthase [Leptospiraceae bacterium]|nr:NAD(+) synthase [Leptospiraceae bacterium]HRG74673.1 NAD(+) synthase [Leptospiraceae bacterium]
MNSYIRIATVVPQIKVGDIAFNTREIISSLENAKKEGAEIVIFPELCITGYTCADLFYQSKLRREAVNALIEIAKVTGLHGITAVVGLPVEVNSKLYNCAALLSNGEIIGIVTKTYLPTTGEFYEERWFSSELDRVGEFVKIEGKEIPFGADLLFAAENLPELKIGIEICEDLWAVIPPSSELAISGATLLLNPSASNEILGKFEYRKELVRQQSARCIAAYVYSSAGANESSTDVVYSGHALVAENGSVIAESSRYSFATEMTLVDIDLERLVNDRIRNSSFSKSTIETKFTEINFTLSRTPKEKLIRVIPRMPFVPSDPAKRNANCEEIFLIQSTGLAKRLKHTNSKKVILGLSGGLDSTLALLVCIKAFEILGLDKKGILCITMPGFGTTDRTRTNAETLAVELGTSLQIISIADAVLQHFKDIGQDVNVHDITYENSQARERTQILMDLANKENALVIGTGDMSELALGWCTYNGDQMSMYGVNAGIPKTLVRYLIEWRADAEYKNNVGKILHDICNTPVSPELLPAKDGEIVQKTEEVVGPYLLHDFFLYYMLRLNYSPSKIFFLAKLAFAGEIESSEIKKWMLVFYKRFFSQQFKRSAMPDGPKVGSVALSPRGDLRMPSDASANLWLAEIEGLNH